MKLTVFLSLLVSLNTFLNPFVSAIGLRAAHNSRSKPPSVSPVSSPTATITGQSAGPTPFIAQINATLTPANSLKSVQFSVTPKSGSVTRPVSATYSSSYLRVGAISIPERERYSSRCLASMRISQTQPFDYRYTTAFLPNDVECNPDSSGPHDVYLRGSTQCRFP
jgi:hypothetical protein